MPESHRLGNDVVRRRGLLGTQVQRCAEPGTPNLHNPVEQAWLGKRPEVDGRSDCVRLDLGAALRYFSILAMKTWPGVTIIAAEPRVVLQ